MQAHSLFSEISSRRKTRSNLTLISKGFRLADLDICISVGNIQIIYYWLRDGKMLMLGFSASTALDVIGQCREPSGTHVSPSNQRQCAGILRDQAPSFSVYRFSVSPNFSDIPGREITVPSGVLAVCQMPCQLSLTPCPQHPMYCITDKQTHIQRG